MDNFRGTILVVEDNFDMRELIQLTLEPEGYRLVMAENGERALQILANHDRPSLIFTDILMPVMGGQELIDTLRKDPLYKNIPIVAMSGGVLEHELRGINRFLKKPFPLSELLQLAAEFVESVKNPTL